MERIIALKRESNRRRLQKVELQNDNKKANQDNNKSESQFGITKIE